MNEMEDLIKKIRAVQPTAEQLKGRTPEYAFGYVDSINDITNIVKNIGDIANVSCSTFTKEELQTIKIDILHIYDKVSLTEVEVHKRNLILNKLKTLLGKEYYS